MELDSIKYKKGIFLLALELVLVFFYSAPSFAQKFTIPVFPDTQGEIAHNPKMFFSQIRWIKNSQDSLHIPIALHVGDIVDMDNYHQWEIASEGFDILDKAHIPYALAVGNHDNRLVGRFNRKPRPGNKNAHLRQTGKFNAYFPVYRFRNQRGRFEPKKSDNAYYTFRVGGLDWMVVTLEFGPRRGAINWAGKIIEDHPNHNVIILTHYFLREGKKGRGIIGTDTNFGANHSPKELNNLLVKKYKNILMVISGHTTASAHRIGKGKNGNKIYEILQDYQTKKYNYGSGYLRLLTIDPNAGTISAKMYSSYYHKTKHGSSQFSFEHVTFIQGKKNLYQDQ
jgi:hypothetical protein